MNDIDYIPVKEPLAQKNEIVNTYFSENDKRHVLKWNRDELEDKYFRLYEENIILKKHARKQEEKIKRMATKLLRFASSKKMNDSNLNQQGPKNLETEEYIDDLHKRLSGLEKQNSQLKEKLMVVKQHLSAQTNKRSTGYNHVQSRIKVGILKNPPADPRLAKSLRVSGPPPANSQTLSPGRQTIPPRYGQSVLDETRAENKRLEEIIGQLNEQINLLHQEVEISREQVRIKETEFEEDLLKVKQQMSQGQRVTIQENIDIIKLQREVKEKATKLTAVQAQFMDLEDKLRTVKESHDQVLRELDDINHDLKLEQSKNLDLQNRLKEGSTAQHALIEYKERVRDVERECQILTEANEKLVSSAFDLEREREWRQREKVLKVQIAQLEATLKADVGEKGTILDRLSGERDSYEKLQEEHRALRTKYYEIKQQNDQLQDKMNFFSQESIVDFNEIEEALVLVRKRKEKKEKNLDFLQSVEETKVSDYEKTIKELRAEHADTINELEKTRNMLIVQHKINKDYQLEVEAVSKKLEENTLEYDTRLEEMANLLDLRAARIRKLEHQMRDIAYGTKQYRPLPATDVDISDVEELGETVELSRGENLFEIHIKKLVLSADALRLMNDQEPSVFCTWEFYEFELQSTPVVKGPSAAIEFTSQYTVKVDDFFLHYLQKDSATIELHQSFGMDYHTFAVGQFNIKKILDNSSGRVHGSAQLIGISDEHTGVNFGFVEYWIRLRVPMQQALRLYKERCKSLGYIESNLRQSEAARQTLDQDGAVPTSEGVNELVVSIKSCGSLKARREDTQPSPYCIYKFFDFEEHDTAVISASNNPHFNDEKVFPVPLTSDLDKYLKTQQLAVYVFDDSDPDDTAYLGIAKVPLIPLSHDKAIQGTFNIVQRNGQSNGTVDLCLRWHHHYMPPQKSTQVSSQRVEGTKNVADKLVLLPGEQEQLASHVDVVSGAPGTNLPPKTPKRGSKASDRPSSSRARFSQPSASSTPMTGYAVASHMIPEMESISASPAVMKSQEPEKLKAQEPEKDAETIIQDDSFISEGSHVTGESATLSDSESAQPENVLESPRITQESPPAEPVSPKPTRESPPTTSPRNTTKPVPPIPTPRKNLMQSLDFMDAPSPPTPKKRPHHQITKKFLITENQRQPVDEYEDREMAAPSSVETKTGEEELGDTMFGDTMEAVEEEEEEEFKDSTFPISEENEDRLSTDSEGVVMIRSSSRLASSSAQNSDRVTVTIANLSLFENTPPMEDENVKLLYVEYAFLGCPYEETETPVSLPKSSPNNQITYNFSKVFHVDREKNLERRQYLADMLEEDSPTQGCVRFTVVSEPPEDTGAECEDVGVATVNVANILKTQKDVIGEDVPIYDINNDEEVIGTMNVTVEALAALNKVKLEMAEPLTTPELTA